MIGRVFAPSLALDVVEQVDRLRTSSRPCDSCERQPATTTLDGFTWRADGERFPFRVCSSCAERLQRAKGAVSP